MGSLGSSMSRDVKALTPEDNNRLKISSVKGKAAGIPAVLSSGMHGISKMGMVKTIKTLTTINQNDGFDCPGCAWPDPAHSSQFEFCENGAKAVADEAMKAKVTPEFFARYDVEQLSKWSDFELNNAGRIAKPVYLESGKKHYQEISWDDAFKLIAKNLNGQSNPDRAVFYTSGKTANETAFLYQAFVRIFGTNNLPDCSNMCHESSGKALQHTIGIGKGTVTLDDFNKANLILVIGQNPGTNHPRMLTALRDAKRNGAKIVNLNPLPETGLSKFKHPQDFMKLNLKSAEKLADYHLNVRIGGDASALKAIMKVIIQEGNVDDEFIQEFTHGYKELVDDLENYSLEDLAQESGISLESLTAVGKLCAESDATIACWAMGLTQQPNAVSVIQEVVNLLLLGGHIGREGAGLCPVRGHSNVQGDRTVGIWESAPDEFIQKLSSGLGIELKYEHGYDVINSIHAMNNGDVDTFFCMGGNFLSATPDTNLTAQAIQKIGLTVQVSTKLNRSHLVTGKEALILPCLGRTEIDIKDGKEQFVTVENSMGVVHTSTGSIKPTSKHLLSEIEIVCRMALETLDVPVLEWDDFILNYDSIRDLMQNCLDGFDDFNQRVRIPGGFSLPNNPRDSRIFDTHNRKANFTLNKLPNLDVGEEKSVMMTIRSHDQYNTTIYGLSDRYRGLKGNRRIVLMNALEMAERGLKSRDSVNITSHYGEKNITSRNWILVPYDIPKGNIATYFPEANELVPIESTAEISNTPTSKWVVVTIHQGDYNKEEE